MKVCHLNQCNPDAAVNTNIVSMIHEKLTNLKFIHDANRTGKLCIQFMDLKSKYEKGLFIRQVILEWHLHRSSY